MNVRGRAWAALLALGAGLLAWGPWANPAVTAAPAAAVTATPPSTVVVDTPQARLTKCQAEANAKNLKDSERQAFVTTCLKRKPVVVANAQAQRMRSCQTEASSRGLQGSERTAFLGSCLKNPP